MKLSNVSGLHRPVGSYMSLPCDLIAFCCTLTLLVMMYAVVISVVQLVKQFIFRCIHVVIESN